VLEVEISLLPGASLFLEALHFQGKFEVETSTDQSKMSYLTFVNCNVKPPARDAKEEALAELEAELEMSGLQDPSASAWRGWLILRDAALTLQIHHSYLFGGAFVEQSTNFNLFASKSSFFKLEGPGFQLVNVTSHIQLEEVTVWNQRSHTSFLQMVLGRPEVHVAGSKFEGSAIEMQRSVDLILDVSNTEFRGGKRAIDVNGGEGHSSQVDLQDVEIKYPSELGVGASDFQSATG